MALSTEIETIALGDLHPDPRNPRLPLGIKGQLEDDDLLRYIADAFEPLIVADSIARHSYFASEPLIVTSEGGKWLVLEGNRRLTALAGLARADLRETFADRDAWNGLNPTTAITVESQIPVLKADQRQDADAVIGFRHIGQILKWNPLQRAQFIAYLVDEREQSFESVSDTVGQDESSVRMTYRNYAILGNAAELGRPDVLLQGQKAFGTYTAAMNRVGLREYVGARPVGDVTERASQMTEDQLPRLLELFAWIFGTEDEPKVIRESRELTRLAAVVQNDAARAELESTRDLDAAFQLAAPPERDYLRQLATAAGHLRSVVESANEIAEEPRARELADELAASLEELNSALSEPDVDEGEI